MIKRAPDLAAPEREMMAENGFALLPNYPNPFNSTTRISFLLPLAQNVTLTVFDLLGREAGTLTEGFRKAGAHTVVFDSRGLCSGTYLCRLQSSGTSVTRKMAVLR